MTKELWYYITPPEGSADEAGWCPASTVQVFLDEGWTITKSDMTVATTADLNLRKGAGTNNPVLTVIPNGTVVTVTGDPWYPVTAAGIAGWVSGAYLDLDAPEAVLTAAQERFPIVAAKYLGCWYRWGGNGPTPSSYGGDPDALTFDCSGYSWWVMGDMGFVTGRVKHSANTQMHMFRDGRLTGERVTGALMPGDWMFFGKDKDRATHVAGYNGGGMLIGANHGNALTKTLAYARKRNARVRLDPEDYRSDLIEVWRPAYR